MIKAIFVDFDWTIYSHKTHRIIPSTMLALKNARENGVKIILATGRGKSELDMMPEYRDIHFDGFITMNGQILLDENEKKIKGFPFEGKLKEEIIRCFNGDELSTVLVFENDTIINFENSATIKAHKEITSLEHECRPYNGEPIYLAVAFIMPEEEDELKARLGACDFKRWSRFGVDIVPQGIDKVTGIKFFLDKYGIKQSECMVFGDSFNDIQMLEYAGIGVAMGNAEEDVKNNADFVAQDIDEDGLFKALKHFKVI